MLGVLCRGCARACRTITVDELRDALSKEENLLEEEINAILEEVDTDKVGPALLPLFPGGRYRRGGGGASREGASRGEMRPPPVSHLPYGIL